MDGTIIKLNNMIPSIRALLGGVWTSSRSASHIANNRLATFSVFALDSKLPHRNQWKLQEAYTLLHVPRRNIFSPAVQEQLQLLSTRHKTISDELMDPNIDPSRISTLSREQSRLHKVVEAIEEFRRLEQEKADLEGMLKDGGSSDAEMTKMIHAELEELEPAFEESHARLLRMLVPKDSADDNDAILEIRAGVGGEEASLFAGEIFRMYEQYASSKGWGWSVIHMQKEIEYGGIREAVVEVTGPGVFGALKYESGVHRVQRVPITQTKGMLQTSTMTVTILPQVEEVDIEIKASDLRIDTYRAQGAGGQHVNTTDSAVRITHIPTGTIVAIQDERSQTQNRMKAMRVLRSRLYEMERQKLADERSKNRKSQIGNSLRSERVRTYNFSQSRVTDHRCNRTTHDIDGFMSGELLDEFINDLRDIEDQEAMENLEADFLEKQKSN